MEIAKGVEVIKTEFFERPLNMVFLQADRTALIDTGLKETPAKAILPYMTELDLSPEKLSLLILTHWHADHIGGNEEIVKASGGLVQIAAHGLDQSWIEDPGAALRRNWGHYVDLGLWKPEDLDGCIEVHGGGVKLDHALEGGEIFDLGQGMELEIVFTPAHTQGSIGILERRSGVLIMGEAVGGTGQYNVKGELIAPPFYVDVELQLRTLKTLAQLNFKTLVPSHYPIMDRNQAIGFLTDSLDFLLRFDAEVQQRLREAKGPVTSMEVLQSMDRLWDLFDADLMLYILLETHLKSLIRRGRVSGSLTEGMTWQGSDDNDLAPLADAARQAIDQMR